MFIIMIVPYHRAIATVDVDVDYTASLLKVFYMSLRLLECVLLIA